MKQGEVVYEFPSLEEIRARRKDQLAHLHESHWRLHNAHEYKVGLTHKLWQKKEQMPTRKPSDLLSSCGSGSRILLRPLQPESGHAAHLNVHLLPKRRESLLDLLRPAEVFQVEQPIDVRPWYTQSAR